MAAISISDCTVFKEQSGSGLVYLTVVTPATADNSDTIAVTLADYGIKTFMKCVGTYQSTENSVCVETAFATSVSTGTLTVTLDATAGSNKKRIAVITGSC